MRPGENQPDTGQPPSPGGRRRLAARLAARLLPPLTPLVGATLAAELIVRVGWISDYLLPAPSQVAAAFRRDGDELLRALGQTAVAATGGLVLATLIGSALAIGMNATRLLRRAMYPYALFFQTVPIIAIAPLLVIWFGYGLPTVMASAFIVSVFPIIANTLTGLLSTDPALLDMFRLYGASPVARLLKLQWPSAWPAVFTGLRIAAGLAVIGAIVGEFIAGGGLGGIIDIARTQQRTDKVFAAILLASALGLSMFTLVNVAASLTLRRWHASERG